VDRVKHGDVVGYVSQQRVGFVFKEIAMRVGLRRGATLIGMSDDQLRNIVRDRTKKVQRRNVRRAMLVLMDLRERHIMEPPHMGRPVVIPWAEDTDNYKRSERWRRRGK